MGDPGGMAYPVTEPASSRCFIREKLFAGLAALISAGIPSAGKQSLALYKGALLQMADFVPV